MRMGASRGGERCEGERGEHRGWSTVLAYKMRCDGLDWLVLLKVHVWLRAFLHSQGEGGGLRGLEGGL